MNNQNGSQPIDKLYTTLDDVQSIQNAIYLSNIRVPELINYIETTLRSIVDVTDVHLVPQHDAGGRISIAAYVACSEKLRQSLPVEGRIEGSAIIVAGEEGSRAVSASSIDRSRTSFDETVRPLLEACPVALTLVSLCEIPRDENGMLDVAKLQEFEKGARDGVIVRDNRLLVGIKDIWKDVLGVAAVEGTSDFFDLGGDSLLAMKVLARIKHMYGLELPLELLFDGVFTPLKLVGAIAELQHKSSDASH